MKLWVGFGAAVFAGGSLGTLLRLGISGAFEQAGQSALLPLLVVNALGAFGLVFYLGRFGDSAKPVSSAHGFFAIGLFGSFTTFSAFSIETVELLQQGDWLFGVGYAGLSIAAGLAAASVARLLVVRT